MNYWSFYICSFSLCFLNISLLKKLGITGKLGVWLHNFLTSRSQVVTTNGASSKNCPVTSGVPQGTVLGPLLFLALMADIDVGVQNATLSSFADDTSIIMKISSPDDVKKLQNDLDTVYRWVSTNNMAFNENKFEALRFGP